LFLNYTLNEVHIKDCKNIIYNLLGIKTVL
jgi:hypothetical protein